MRLVVVMVVCSLAALSCAQKLCPRSSCPPGTQAMSRTELDEIVVGIKNKVAGANTPIDKQELIELLMKTAPIESENGQLCVGQSHMVRFTDYLSLLVRKLFEMEPETSSRVATSSSRATIIPDCKRKFPSYGDNYCNQGMLLTCDYFAKISPVTLMAMFATRDMKMAVKKCYLSNIQNSGKSLSSLSCVEIDFLHPVFLRDNVIGDYSAHTLESGGTCGN